MKVLCALILCFLLLACGQTGPLYMPGTATGVHKKDEFVLGNNSDAQKKAPTAKSHDNSNRKPVAETVTHSNTNGTKSAGDSTASEGNSEPLEDGGPVREGQQAQ